ncbi:TetR/AcrR family transcriptional regulator [Mycolicibacterium parafortuitum]|uniref:Transcriptional regulator [Desulfosporosinus orientis DSM 765] n=1 Tax=Mycolicibacterium parafortuitum TaxID=39692 RepID=A0A375YP61_MYCPF|nr:TetR/AcrR family transcriptional regulator [Mycolicibacterium parafortuitum]SRX82871.1 transcriptional regulator [Desulfosporosinus orientis DSM 765] [Mycolicibacterium parafortuitum]
MTTAPVVSTRTTQRRGRPRDDRLDATIVNATIAEVGAKGWGGATIEGIAARAGVGRGTIYRRWPSKTELFQYAAAAVTRPVEAPDTGSFVDDLFSAVLPIADMLTQPDLAALLPSLLAEAANDASIRQTLRTFVARSRQQAIEAVERARRRGDIVQSTDAETLVDMLAGALVYRRLLLGETTDAAAVRVLVRQAVQSCSTSEAIEENS